MNDRKFEIEKLTIASHRLAFIADELEAAMNADVNLKRDLPTPDAMKELAAMCADESRRVHMAMAQFTVINRNLADMGNVLARLERLKELDVTVLIEFVRRNITNAEAKRKQYQEFITAVEAEAEKKRVRLAQQSPDMLLARIEGLESKLAEKADDEK